MSGDIDTVADLREKLKEYDGDTLVRVNDDGMAMKINVRERNGTIEL